MRAAVQRSTLHWRWVRDIAKPKVVQHRHTEMPEKSGNFIVQVTVRFESEQVRQ